MSSHREAPESSKDPVADNTDVYAFRSTDPDEAGTVTLIANYIPFQLPSGGPNFAEFSDEVLYTINVSNTSGGNPDIVFDFKFTTTVENKGTFLYNTGPIKSLTDKNWSRRQTYTVEMTKNGNRTTLGTNLKCPPVNVGVRSTPNYAKLAEAAVYKNPASNIKIFAGQRAEGFYVDLGSVFDLAGIRPANMAHIIPLANAPGVNGTQAMNVHSIAIQLPVSMLTSSGSQTPDPTTADAVIGVWATAQRQTARVFNTKKGVWDNSGSRVQVSRLANPLINELINPTAQKDKWNSSAPSGDSAYLQNYLQPVIAADIAALYPTLFPNLASYVKSGKPRNDLKVILLTGIPKGLIPQAPNFQNQVGDGNTLADMVRLNMGIAPTPESSSNPGGLLALDPAGYPNGRRVFDNVTAISLQAVAGAALPLADSSYTADKAAMGLSDRTSYTNGDKKYLTTFPYLGVPDGGYETLPGNPKT